MFCVTITGTLSGSYNAAVVAKDIYEREHPNRRVYVLNSLSAGQELCLIIEKLQELIVAKKGFDEITEEIKRYTKKTSLYFMLESMKNLANNGRVNPMVAKMAVLFGIRVVGRERLRKKILKELPKVQIFVYKCRGLCSFYAEKGGMLVAFERM